MKRKEIRRELEKSHEDGNLDTREIVRRHSLAIVTLSRDIEWIKWILGAMMGLLIALISLTV